jgi:capsid protein
MLKSFRKKLSSWLYPGPKPSAESLNNFLRARYDAAQYTDEFKHYWANSDWWDADSAHSIEVRQPLTRRSRYEVANNGFADGIASTCTTDLVGNGPSLRMQTGSEGFNRMVEDQWNLWCKAIRFRRKLWCMAHAKHVDGEGMAVMRMNPGVKHKIQLDITLHETEQFHTPFVPFTDPHYIDGLKFDNYGNPIFYDLLKYHPGSKKPVDFTFVPDKISADLVLHWFKQRRPGQHRGVPEMSSTLNLGAQARRFREANLSTAEKVASWTLFLKTIFQPDELAAVTPMSTLDIAHNMMTALPNSVEPFQLKAEHPASSYAEFNKTLINEQARPKSMPLNKAACDSSSYNYASGRLDHQTYYAAVDIEREDCNDLVLDPLFDKWFSLAIATFKWLGGNADAVGPAARAHSWDWPKHQVADVEAEANANTTNLKNGTLSLSNAYSNAGQDFEEEILKMAADFGKTPEEVRERLFDVLLPLPRGVYQPEPPPSEGVPQAKPGLSPLSPGTKTARADWVTLDNGVHVDIGPDGTVQKGPANFVGKNINQLRDAAKASKTADEKTKAAVDFDHSKGEDRAASHSTAAQLFRESQNAHKEAAEQYRQLGDVARAGMHESAARQSKGLAVFHEKLAKTFRSPGSKEARDFVTKMMSSDGPENRLNGYANGNGLIHASP